MVSAALQELSLSAELGVNTETPLDMALNFLNTCFLIYEYIKQPLYVCN